MTRQKKRPRGRPPSIRKLKVSWESAEDPDAEELLLQALEMLLPEVQSPAGD